MNLEEKEEEYIENNITIMDQEDTESDIETEIIESSSSGSESDSDLDSDFDRYLFTDYDTTRNQQILADVENIAIDETNFLDSEKQDKKYYIGFAMYNRPCGKYWFDIAITCKSFFKYPISACMLYLNSFSLFQIRNSRLIINIQIMQLHIDPISKQYNVVLKTFWLRIVQRTWKRIYKEKKSLILKRQCSIFNRRHLETTGKHLPEFRHIPNIFNMQIR